MEQPTTYKNVRIFLKIRNKTQCRYNELLSNWKTQSLYSKETTLFELWIWSRLIRESNSVLERYMIRVTKYLVSQKIRLTTRIRDKNWCTLTNRNNREILTLRDTIFIFSLLQSLSLSRYYSWQNQSHQSLSDRILYSKLFSELTLLNRCTPNFIQI